MRNKYHNSEIVDQIAESVEKLESKEDLQKVLKILHDYLIEAEHDLIEAEGHCGDKSLRTAAVLLLQARIALNERKGR